MSPRVGLYAKVVVAAVFVLIFLGGLVTSWEAGMAVPDWPLSFGVLNPDGWWGNLPVRMEHGHRQFAELVGLLTTVLCACVWRNGWLVLRALGLAVCVGALSGVIGFIISFSGTPPWTPGRGLLIGVVGLLVSFAVGFPIALVLSRRVQPGRVQWLALTAYFGVLLQATLGGVRVTLGTAKADAAATAFRIMHGCVAQAELCLLVAIAAMLSSAWIESSRVTPAPGLPRRLAWWAVAAVYTQLIFGATMRHLGAGLAIPTFPQASPAGSWLPQIHNAYIDINFTHTRFGALTVAVLLLLLVFRTLRHSGGERRLVQPAWALLALLAIQITLGILVIWYTKPRTLTTFHVLNGAILLATTLLLALRLNQVPAAVSAEAAGEALSDREFIAGGTLNPAKP